MIPPAKIIAAHGNEHSGRSKKTSMTRLLRIYCLAARDISVDLQGDKPAGYFSFNWHGVGKSARNIHADGKVAQKSR
jgi:hypothetical protein